MSQGASESFDPFAVRAAQAAKEGRANAARRIVKRLVHLVILAVLVVVVMNVLGGSDQPTAWREAGRVLSVVREQRSPQGGADRLLMAAKEIENKRGNSNALEGLYAVCALQYLSDGQSRRAADVIQTLRADFDTGRLFREYWEEQNLTEPCGSCSLADGRQILKCAACGGSGQSAGLVSGMKGAPGGTRQRKCLSCNGQGRVSDPSRASTCQVCGGSGRVLSKTVVLAHRDKALTKAQVVTALKRVQCALSLRFLLGESKPGKLQNAGPEATSDAT